MKPKSQKIILILPSLVGTADQGDQAHQGDTKRTVYFILDDEVED